MRRLLFILSLLVVFGCSETKSQLLQADSHRTLEINGSQLFAPQTHLSIHSAVEYHDRYYCLINCNTLWPIECSKLLLSIDCQTLEYRWEEFPNNLRNGYYDDFYVRHDTLFISVYGSWSKNDYFFDTTQRRWVEIEKQSALVFEDDDYQIFTIDHGEWGDFTWFSNRHNGNQYVMPGSGFVRRVADTYYVVGPAWISAASTSQLEQSLTAPISYEEAAHRYMFYDDSAFFVDDTTLRFVIPDDRFVLANYNYFTFLYEGADTMFEGSFVVDDSLFLLAKYHGDNAIMFFDGHTPILVEKELDSCDFIRYTHNVRGFLRNDRLLLPFEKDETTMGLLDIRGRQFHTLDIHISIDTLQLLPTDPFIQTIEYLANNWGTLKDTVIRKKEESLGGAFILSDPPSAEPRNGYFKDLGLKDCHVDWFFKTVDTMYTIETEYCIDNITHDVRAVFCDYMSPVYYKNDNKRHFSSDDTKTEVITATLKEKLNSLCGKPKLFGINRDYTVWHYGPLTIRLYTGDNRILIYKE